MTHDIAKQSLKDLERRLAEAKGPDRELDLGIIKAMRLTDPTAFYDVPNDCLAWYEPHSEVPGCPSELCGDELPRLTASLDAAVSLTERVLPGWAIELRLAGSRDGEWHWNARVIDPSEPDVEGDDPRTFYATKGDKRGALALCLAATRALIAGADQ